MHVMIATDGTEAAERAVLAALELFGHDATYSVVSIGVPVPVTAFTPLGVAPTLMRVGDESGAIADTMAPAQAAAEHAAAELGGRHVETVVDVGGPGPTICRLAEERAVDVLVVGAHDRGWLSRLVRPSTTHDLVDNAPCHVLVVRDGDQER